MQLSGLLHRDTRLQGYYKAQNIFGYAQVSKRKLLQGHIIFEDEDHGPCSRAQQARTVQLLRRHHRTEISLPNPGRSVLGSELLQAVGVARCLLRSWVVCESDSAAKS